MKNVLWKEDFWGVLMRKNSQLAEKETVSALSRFPPHWKQNCALSGKNTRFFREPPIFFLTNCNRKWKICNCSKNTRYSGYICDFLHVGNDHSLRIPTRLPLYRMSPSLYHAYQQPLPSSTVSMNFLQKP